jgi:molybdopterin/thiamine biosynthesis adenylyltransferase
MQGPLGLGNMKNRAASRCVPAGVIAMAPLSDWEREKYRRQIMIPGFGEAAQEKLKASSVLVTRVGGLGGPIALWLAAAGVGRLVLAHGGNLTPSNLNRQILMRGSGVGQPRIEQARETLRRFNPDCDVIAWAEDPTPELAREWVRAVDLVCSATPDFRERLWLNEACVAEGKPLVNAGMDNMEAQLTVIVPGQTPCLRCLVPEQPAWWDPYGFGVLGAVSGSLGALAALEAVKVLTGYGTPLLGKLLRYECTEWSFVIYELERDPNCPVCSHLWK